jgi:hypothetical protein
MGLISLDGPVLLCNPKAPVSYRSYRPALFAAHDDCVVVVLAAGAEQQLLRQQMRCYGPSGSSSRQIIIIQAVPSVDLRDDARPCGTNTTKSMLMGGDGPVRSS